MNKANSIINNFLLACDKFMPELLNYIWLILLLKSTVYIIYKNDLDKACFQHDMAYNKFKDLEKRTQSDEVLDKAFKIASNPKYNGYERGLASTVNKFFDKKLKGSGLKNQQLSDELHKPIIRKFTKRKVYSSFKNNIWCVDLADMQLISKYNKGIKYLLCVIDLFTKYAWVVPLKDKKGATITNALQKVLDGSKRKPNKLWVDQASEFCNNDISTYSTHNEGKSAVAGRFIRTLKNKIYKHMTAVSAVSVNAYFDVLDNIVDEYNNTYHKTIKMKP